MTNYSTLSYNLTRGICKFAEKISKNLKRPEFKFVTQMIYGILDAQSTHLSKIGRALEEPISLKKTIDRLSRNLNEFKSAQKLFDNYLKTVKPQFNDRMLLVIDGSDLAKPFAKKMENSCIVRDGSTGEYVNGYHTLGVVALTKEKKMPIPVYTRIYSSEEKEFVSEDTEVLSCLKSLTKNFNKKNIRAFDRGYDANVYYKYLLKNDEKFVIRAKKNRDVIYKGERINIMELAKKFKGKYKLDFKNRSGRKAACKISIVPIKLPCVDKKELNLVVVYGFSDEPMLLITNIKSDDNRLPVVITKVYLLRWRIEEFYRFKKYQLNFEDLRVRSLNSIRNLDILMTIAIGYIGKMSINSDERIAVMEIIVESRRIHGVPNFTFYAIADGLARIFHRCKQGVANFLLKQPKSTQLCFFPHDGFSIA